MNKDGARRGCLAGWAHRGWGRGCLLGPRPFWRGKQAEQHTLESGGGGGMSGAHLSFTSSFTPELAWRAWFIMSYTNDNCEQAGRRAVREAGGCSAGPAPSPKRATEPGRGQGEEAGGRQARGYGVGGRVQLGAEKPGPPPTLPAGSCKGRLPLHRSEGRRGGQSLHLSPASRAPAEPG